MDCVHDVICTPAQTQGFKTKTLIHICVEIRGFFEIFKSQVWSYFNLVPPPRLIMSLSIPAFAKNALATQTDHLWSCPAFSNSWWKIQHHHYWFVTERQLYTKRIFIGLDNKYRWYCGRKNKKNLGSFEFSRFQTGLLLWSFIVIKKGEIA